MAITKKVSYFFILARNLIYAFNFSKFSTQLFFLQLSIKTLSPKLIYTFEIAQKDKFTIFHKPYFMTLGKDGKKVYIFLSNWI